MLEFILKDCRMSKDSVINSNQPTSDSSSIYDEAHSVNTSSRNYFDYGTENNCPILFKISGHDDYSYGKFTIRKNFFFFKNVYSMFYINTNGFISFSYFDPSTLMKFPLTSVSVIAPFWSDIDMRFGGNIFHKEINETDVLNSINADIRKRCPNLNYRSEWAHIVTWSDAPVYLTLDDRYGSKFQFRNNFQALLTTNGVNSFVIFNYDRLDWPNQVINSTFQAGYNSADSNFYILENKNKSTLLEKSNINKPGRWVLPLNENINC